MRRPLAAVLGYFAELNTARAVLWCYLIWYLGVLLPWFDPAPSLWLSSLGISAIIGTGLYLGTAHAGPKRTELNRYQVFRLYLMPFCVSSFAALIKGRGFLLVLHPTLAQNVPPVCACAAFLLLWQLARRFRTNPVTPAAAHASTDASVGAS